MAFALLTPIAIEVAKSIGMGVVTTGLERLISGKNIFTGNGKHGRRKLKGGADPDPTLVKAIEDLTLQHLTGEGKTRKKRTKKLKGGNFMDDIGSAMGSYGNLVGTIVGDVTGAPVIYKALKKATGNGRSGAGRSGAGKSGGAKKTSPWIERVQEYRKKHGVSYKEALIKLGKSNKK
jgi:hypothetical protein